MKRESWRESYRGRERERALQRQRGIEIEIGRGLERESYRGRRTALTYQRLAANTSPLHS